MGRVSGKVALITGAARGQGRSIALRLAEEGADIIAVDLAAQIGSVRYELASADDLAETVEMVTALGSGAVQATADVRDPAALADAVRRGVSEFGRLDIVAANAGMISHAPVLDMTEEQWEDVLAVNLTGAWNTARATIPAVRETGGGSIIFTSSTAGLKGARNMSHYISAKHGVVGLMRALTHELAADSIRVNSVHPTLVNTGFIQNEAAYKRYAPDADPADAPRVMEERLRGANLLPVSWVEPEDIANAVLFLGSDEARYITGVALPIDAGNAAK